MRWTELRPIQVDAIHSVVETEKHIIIAATTAGGKTEAAFLPVLSQIADSATTGVRAMYVGPLKALINDQFRRLEELCSLASIPVMKWHGDVDASKKRELLKDPQGVLLITPESIESLFINHASKIEALFKSLAFIVIDEVHAFVGSERGAHLHSLLCRMRQICDKPPRLISLSATVGDPKLTAEWIHPGHADAVKIIEDSSGKRSIKYLIKGYLRKPVAKSVQNDDAEFVATEADVRLAEDLLKNFYGKTALVFANAKARIEFLADQVRRIESARNMPDQIQVHHGSLSRAEREQAEEDLRSGRPTVAFCSSTLELGIDVGNVSAVGQVGPPWSVSSLAQRLGRSGRKEGESAVLWFYVQEDQPQKDSDPITRLYPELLQSVAMTELLLQKWCEPLDVRRLHLSTLVQQILSVIAERGGASAKSLFDVLVAHGAFINVDKDMFVQVLRSLASHDLIEQSPERDLILGMKGEQIVRAADFYAAFMGSEEMDVIHAGKCIGSVAGSGIAGSEFIILAGRRWKVLEVNLTHKEIIVEPAMGARLPTFASSGGGEIHDQVRQEMRRVVLGKEVPVYLDAEAKDMLLQAREAACALGLETTSMLQSGTTVYWFTWAGSRINRTLVIMLKSSGLRAWDAGIAIGIEKSDIQHVTSCLAVILVKPPSTTQLAGSATVKISQKYDPFLSDSLLTDIYAANCLDCAGALRVAAAAPA